MMLPYFKKVKPEKLNTVAQIRRAVNELQSRDSDVVSNDRL